MKKIIGSLIMVVFLLCSCFPANLEENNVTVYMAQPGKKDFKYCYYIVTNGGIITKYYTNQKFNIGDTLTITNKQR